MPTQKEWIRNACAPAADVIRKLGEGKIADFYHVNTDPGWLLGGMAARRNLANSEVVNVIRDGLLEIGVKMYAGKDVKRLESERARLKSLKTQREKSPSDESKWTLADRCIYMTVRFRLKLDAGDGGTIRTAVVLLSRAMGKSEPEMLLWMKGKISHETWKESLDK